MAYKSLDAYSYFVLGGERYVMIMEGGVHMDMLCNGLK